MRRSPIRRALAGACAPASMAVLALVFALTAVRDCAAGPWVQTRNGYFVTARLGWLSTSKYYDASGNVVDASSIVKYKDRSVQFDTEYGLTSRLSLMMGMPMRFLSATLPMSSPSNFSNNGMGDLLFGFKYGFLNPAGRAAVALEVDAVTPTGYNSQGFGVPSLGRGKYSTYGRVHAGTTFDPAPVYVQGEVGYRKFTDDQVSNAVIFGGEAGIFATPRILIVGEYRAEKSQDKNKPYFEDLTQVGGNVQYRVKPHLDVLAGLRTTVSGKNANKGAEIRLGVSLKGNDLGRYRGQTAAGFSEGVFPVVKPLEITPVPQPAPEPAVAPAPTDSSTTPAPPPAPEPPK